MNSDLHVFEAALNAHLLKKTGPFGDGFYEHDLSMGIADCKDESRKSSARTDIDNVFALWRQNSVEREGV